MAKARRKRKSGGLVWGFRFLILVIITCIMASSAYRKLSSVAMSESYPTAKQQYEQALTEKSGIQALRSVLKGQAETSSADKTPGGRKPSNVLPELASVTLAPPIDDPETSEPPETELIEISEPLFRGKMLKVKDPARVYVGVAGPLGLPTSYGRQIGDMVADYGAVAAVNANGFVDPNGTGNGGMPVGIVISQGELCYGDLYSYYDICGFDQDGQLHVGWMTGQQAIELGIRDAACFGPSLIKDGVKQDVSGRFGGYNPRTVVGQLEDGTVVLLLIEGRMFTSLGLTYQQLVDYCYDLGMVNASNMDGGASSVMYYGSEQATIVSTLYGARNMPNCWLVAPEN